MTIYLYGPVAWVWRLFAGLGVVAGLALTALSLRDGFWAGFFVGLPLMLPGLVLAPMVAVRVDRLADGRVIVHTLAFWRRTLARERLGMPKLKIFAQAGYHGVRAPRIWVPVKGGLPIHVDLYGKIPDRKAFLAVFSLPPRQLP